MIVGYDELSSIREKHQGDTIVLVKGTFDLFHTGHVNLLKRAKALGDILVVIVKCDDAVKTKSPGRPILDESNRAALVDAIQYTDYCIIANRLFPSHDTAFVSNRDKNQYERYAPLIQALKPDIVIRQPDHEIPPSLLRVYQECSTQILELQRTKGISTTEIIDKIRRTFP